MSERPKIILVGPYADAIPILNACLSAGPCAVTVSETARLAAIPQLIEPDTDAAVVLLHDRHNPAELREVVGRHPAVAFLLVAPMKPPRAALARLAGEAGAALVCSDDGPLVIAAMLFSILAQRALT